MLYAYLLIVICLFELLIVCITINPILYGGKSLDCRAGDSRDEGTESLAFFQAKPSADLI